MSQQNIQTQSTAGQQTDLLFGLIHVGPKLLHQFISGSRESLDSIKMLLGKARRGGDYQVIVEPVLRIVHGIKGSASLFDLTLYIEIAHRFEDTLRRMRGKAKPEKVVAEVDELIVQLERALDETAVLLEPLSWLKHVGNERISRTQAFLTGAALLVEELARANHVNAALHCPHFDLEPVPPEYSREVVEVLTQLIRNAVVHGIEPPNERQESGKSVKGRIFLASRHSSKYYRFSVQDDGRGLNPEELRAAVAALVTSGSKAVEVMTSAELAAFLFEPGFTTAKSPSHSSGSGMGLDLVVQKLVALGGRLEFVFTRGDGCRFDVILPLPKA